MTPEDRKAIEAIVATLEAAWNAGDARAFASQFAVDADFVNIRAEHFTGREAIAIGHEHIFRTIYAGSINRLTLESVRYVGVGVALAHVRAALEAPAGPMAGSNGAIFSLVLTCEAVGRWRIDSLHNTLAPRVPA